MIKDAFDCAAALVLVACAACVGWGVGHTTGFKDGIEEGQQIELESAARKGLGRFEMNPDNGETMFVWEVRK